jgi:hypothetical protein
MPIWKNVTNFIRAKKKVNVLAIPGASWRRDNESSEPTNTFLHYEHRHTRTHIRTRALSEKERTKAPALDSMLGLQAIPYVNALHTMRWIFL